MDWICRRLEVTNDKLNDIVAKNTAFKDFDELVNAHPGYRPTIRVENRDLVILADAYDLEMQDRGDERRAYRTGGKKLLPRTRGWVFVNQGKREANCAAVVKGKALIEYQMPNGRDYLWEVDQNLTWDELIHGALYTYKTVGEKAARKKYPQLYGNVNQEN